MHAPRADQLKLLEVAELDGRLARLRAENKNHPLREEVGAQMNLVAAKGRELNAARAELAKAGETMEAASAKTAEIAKVVKEKEDRLNAGIGMDSRELMALQSEVETHKGFLDESQDAEFAALEHLEAVGEEIAALEAEQSLINKRIVDGRAQLEDAVAELEAEAADITRAREEIYAPLAQDLKDAYERSRAQGSMPVIAVHRNGQTSGGIELSPIELSKIKNGDPDELHISDEYQCIVVLLDS